MEAVRRGMDQDKEYLANEVRLLGNENHELTELNNRQNSVIRELEDDLIRTKQSTQDIKENLTSELMQVEDKISQMDKALHEAGQRESDLLAQVKHQKEQVRCRDTHITQLAEEVAQLRGQLEASHSEVKAMGLRKSDIEDKLQNAKFDLQMSTDQLRGMG